MLLTVTFPAIKFTFTQNINTVIHKSKAICATLLQTDCNYFFFTFKYLILLQLQTLSSLQMVDYR